MKKKVSAYSLAYTLGNLRKDFIEDGYLYVGSFVEGLGSSRMIDRLQHNNGNTVDLMYGANWPSIVVKKNGKVIKEVKI